MNRTGTQIAVAVLLSFAVLHVPLKSAFGQFSERQLSHWLKRFPEADANGDGQLTSEEAEAFRKTRQAKLRANGQQRGAPREFQVDPGWQKERFPEEAVCYRTPQEIAAIYGKVISVPKPTDGSLRIVGTGHSFMSPGYGRLPKIAEAAGFRQQTLLTHTSGGITGSARYKWEQENGIFEFAGRPTPKLLASISNGSWDVMMWGPYFHDRPEYYSCWMDFCLKYHPNMKFYLSDAWPQLYQLEKLPKSESELSSKTITRMGKERHTTYAKLINALNKKYPGKVFVLPTSDAMVLAAQYYHRDELPGVEGIHRVIGKKERSLWRDQLGHLGPGFDRLEGYVFFATIYGRSPELITDEIRFGGSSEFPGKALDRVFRKIAWQAAVNNPLSGVTDKNNNGIDDKQDKAANERPNIQPGSKALPIPGESLSFDGREAFIILPQNANKNIPWVWYAPTLSRLPEKSEVWMFKEFLAKGIAIAGVDVGESFGSPKGTEVYNNFYDYLIKERQFRERPCLLARSRGGLMLYNWAINNPKRVGGIAGIYPVCNLASYPGVERAAGAYGLKAEQLASSLTRYNPIDRLETLAKSGVPVFHIHGDSDNVVPLKDNSAELAKRYRAFGGPVQIEVVKGQGHNMWEGWFKSQRLTDFAVARALGKPLEPGLTPIEFPAPPPKDGSSGNQSSPAPNR